MPIPTRVEFPSPPVDEFVEQGTWLRLTGGLRRRVRRAKQMVSGDPRPIAPQRALDWLLETESSDNGDFSGPAIQTALNYGQRPTAAAWARRLIAAQRSDGTYAAADGEPSNYHTALALEGLLAAEAAELENDELARIRAVHSAAKFLCGRIDEGGRLQPSGGAGSIDRFGPPGLGVVCVSVLIRAAERLGHASWQQAAQRGLTHFKRSEQLERWSAPLHLMAPIWQALLDLDEIPLVRHALQLPTALQRVDGGVPAMPDADWISSAGLAQLASLWLQLGDRQSLEHAEAAIEHLAVHQQANGGFAGSWGPAARYFAGQTVSATAVHFLQAAWRQVHTAFDTQQCDFPAVISEDDPRLNAVLRWRSELSQAAHVADLGCGRGRYLRALGKQSPSGRLTGVDVSPVMLRSLPDGADARQGSLLHVPAADGEFDGAICIEALEHSLTPKMAIAEMCRTLRPGGTLLVIDKDRRRQALSECQRWERWFTTEELRSWLSPWCEEVHTQPLDHGAGGRLKGLFVMAVGRKKASAVRAA